MRISKKPTAGPTQAGLTGKHFWTALNHWWGTRKLAFIPLIITGKAMHPRMRLTWNISTVTHYGSRTMAPTSPLSPVHGLPANGCSGSSPLPETAWRMGWKALKSISIISMATPRLSHSASMYLYRRTRTRPKIRPGTATVLPPAPCTFARDRARVTGRLEVWCEMMLSKPWLPTRMEPGTGSAGCQMD